MKQLRFFFCVLVLSLNFVVLAHADDTDYTNPIENVDSGGNASGLMVKGDTTNYFGWTLLASGGVAFDGDTLSGGGKAVPATVMGSTYTGTLNYRPQYSAYSFSARYQGISTPYTKITAFNPQSFNVAHTDIQAMVNFRPKADSVGWKNFYVGLGYFSHARTVDQTLSPLGIIDQTLGGPVVAVGNQAALSSKFNYDVDLYLKFINSITETKQATSGQFQNGYAAELTFTVVYPYTDLLDVALGVWASMNSITFKGAGTRGVTNAVESETVYGVPLEFRFKF